MSNTPYGPQGSQQPYGQQPQYGQQPPPTQPYGQQPPGGQPPFPPQYGGPGSQPQPPKRPWFKKKRFLIPGALLALIIISSIASGGGGDKSPTTTSSVATTTVAPTDDPASSAQASDPSATKPKSASKPAPKPQGPGIGDPVKVGDLKMTITSVKCGPTKVGDEYVNEKAQGKFCLVRLKTTNVGSDQADFSPDAQKLFDSEGREFTYSSAATITADPESISFDSINPGNTREVTLIYDVPKSAKPVKATLAAGFLGTDTADVSLIH